MDSTKNKIVVEIWTDIMCPFCYIGKRKFETALSQFSGKENVQIVWKSFQLSPEMETDTTKSIHEYLSEHKGISLQEAKAMSDHVAQLALQVNLTFNFAKSVVANTFKAHRFSHFAKQNGKQNEAEEKLFQAYFTDGKNIDDNLTLIQLGSKIGLNETEITGVLQSDTFADEVREEFYEAQQVGVRGVPFFLINRKYAISGAQESKLFLETLERSLVD